jgi:type IV secretory pathway VirB3-like protein
VSGTPCWFWPGCARRFEKVMIATPWSEMCACICGYVYMYVYMASCWFWPGCARRFGKGVMAILWSEMCMYVCMRVYVCVCMYVCVYVCVCVWMYVYMYIQCAHPDTYIHTHLHAHPGKGYSSTQNNWGTLSYAVHHVESLVRVQRSRYICIHMCVWMHACNYVWKSRKAVRDTSRRITGAGPKKLIHMYTYVCMRMNACIYICYLHIQEGNTQHIT